MAKEKGTETYHTSFLAVLLVNVAVVLGEVDNPGGVDGPPHGLFVERRDAADHYYRARSNRRIWASEQVRRFGPCVGQVIPGTALQSLRQEGVPLKIYIFVISL